MNVTVANEDSLKDAGFEAIGAGDAYQGLSTLKAIAGMEALRALPAEAQLEAVSGLTQSANIHDNAVASYNDWAVGNPNAAMVVGGVVDRFSNSINKKISAISPEQRRADKLSKIDRSGKDFTKAGKDAVIELNKQKNNGIAKCENCGIETVKSKKSMSGVIPPSNETQVDHVVAKSKGGSGTPNNGQVLCRSCNRKKSNK